MLTPCASKIKLSVCISWLLLAFSSSVIASSFNEPHSHQGVVAPFQPGDPKVSLDKKALNILGQGRPYQVSFRLFIEVFAQVDNSSLIVYVSTIQHLFVLVNCRLRFNLEAVVGDL